jgi:hypothetical protein
VGSSCERPVLFCKKNSPFMIALKTIGVGQWIAASAEMPDAMELIFQTALVLGKEAAVLKPSS